MDLGAAYSRAKEQTVSARIAKLINNFTEGWMTEGLIKTQEDLRSCLGGGICSSAGRAKLLYIWTGMYRVPTRMLFLLSCINIAWTCHISQALNMQGIS